MSYEVPDVTIGGLIAQGDFLQTTNKRFMYVCKVSRDIGYVIKLIFCLRHVHIPLQNQGNKYLTGSIKEKTLRFSPCYCLLNLYHQPTKIPKNFH